MTVKDEVLRFLRQAEGDVSGEELSERLGISRTAVWKAINVLRGEGCEIASATRRGYRLLKEADLLRPQEITEGLGTAFLGGEAVVLEEVDSTNEEAKRSALRGAADGTVFAAERQTGGKGRLGRSWESPSGTGVYFTVLLRTAHIPEPLTNTTLLAGMAVARALNKLLGVDARIKWPNDVVIGSKKICGILTEMGAEMDSIQYVVVGIGINANNSAFPAEVAAKATSLLLETGAPVHRAEVLRAVLRELDALLCEKDFPLAEYKALCVSLDKKVRFTRRGQSETGVAVDISASGELLVRADSDGETTAVSTGEVVVQGIYGQTV